MISISYVVSRIKQGDLLDARVKIVKSYNIFDELVFELEFLDGETIILIPNDMSVYRKICKERKKVKFHA